MSQEVADEIRLFFDAVALGCALAIIYDILLILRNVFTHDTLVISVEDGIYWIMTSVISFLVLYRVNEGVVRWFFIAGATIGMFLYKESISKYIVRFMSTVISYLVKVVKKIAYLVVQPVKWLIMGIKQICVRIKKFGLFVKKKLTVCIKLVRITLCKHNTDNANEK